MGLRLTSTAFEPGGAIPRRYTCDGPDLSPPLSWSGLPEKTRSLVLVVDDPDAPDPAAPKVTWVHWVLYNIFPSAVGLPEATDTVDLPDGTREGLNDWRHTGYRGPCPPTGRHRYFHKLYALDTVLPDLGPVTKAQLKEEMEGHILDQVQLMGMYQRQSVSDVEG